MIDFNLLKSVSKHLIRFSVPINLCQKKDAAYAYLTNKLCFFKDIESEKTSCKTLEVLQF